MWDDILTLLAIAVLADHRVRDPELIEFCHQAQFLSYIIDPDRIVSRRSTVDWFRSQEAEIDKCLKADDAESYIRTAYQKITDSDLQPQLMQAVFAICICDYDLHDEESRIIQIGVSTWNMSLADTMAVAEDVNA